MKFPKLHKKAQLLIAGSVIVLLLALSFAVLQNLRNTNNQAMEYPLGQLQSEMVKLYTEGEQMRKYIDMSAEQSLLSSLVALSSGGGIVVEQDEDTFQEPPCGQHVSSILLRRDKNCVQTESVFSDNLKEEFNAELSRFLSSYTSSRIPLNNYNLEVLSSAGKTEILGRGRSKTRVTFGAASQTGGGSGSFVFFDSGSIWPVDSNADVLSCYGNRILNGRSDFHDGIDISLPAGSAVLAPLDGEIIDVCNEWQGSCACSVAESSSCRANCNGKCGNYGNFIIIKHSDNFFTRYSHLSKIVDEIASGQKKTVAKGEKIAETGSTGMSFGPHLDFKVYAVQNFAKDTAVNPFCFFSEQVLNRIGVSDSAASCKEIYGISNPSTFTFTKTLPALAHDCSVIEQQYPNAFTLVEENGNDEDNGQTPSPDAGTPSAPPETPPQTTPQTPPETPPANPTPRTGDAANPSDPAADQTPEENQQETCAISGKVDFSQIKPASEVGLNSYESAIGTKEDFIATITQNNYNNLAYTYSQQHKNEIPVEFVLGILRTETKANPEWEHKCNSVNACGLFQVQSGACSDVNTAGQSMPEFGSCAFKNSVIGNVEDQFRIAIGYMRVVEGYIKGFTDKNSLSYYYFLALSYNAGAGFTQKLIEQVAREKGIDKKAVQWKDIDQQTINRVADSMSQNFYHDTRKKQEMFRYPNLVVRGMAELCGFSSYFIDYASTAYAATSIEYSIDTSFRAKANYDMAVFKKMRNFALQLNRSCEDSYGFDVEPCVEYLVDDFNAANSGSGLELSQGSCGDEYLYTFADKYFDCLNSNDENCACQIKEKDITGQDASDKQYIKVWQKSFELKTDESWLNGDESLYTLLLSFNPLFFREKPDSQDKTTTGENIFIWNDADKPLNLYKPFLDNFEKKIIFVDDKEDKRECSQEKTSFSFCLKTNNFLPYKKTVVQGDSKKSVYTYEKVNINFAVDLTKALYPFEELKYIELGREGKTFFIWKFPEPDDVHSFGVYSSLSPFIGITEQEFDSRLNPTTENPVAADLVITEQEFLPSDDEVFLRDAFKGKDLDASCISPFNNDTCIAFLETQSIAPSKIYWFKNNYYILMIEQSGMNVAFATTSRYNRQTDFVADETYWQGSGVVYNAPALPGAGPGVPSMAETELIERLHEIYNEIDGEFSVPQTESVVIVLGQKLYLVSEDWTGIIQVQKEYDVSTSAYGYGFEQSSNKTPLGTFKIFEKIGVGVPLGGIFSDKVYTGSIAEIYTEPGYDAPVDYMTTRLLVLTGLEPENGNTINRGIFLHGTAEEGRLGTPASHGCVRMRNTDVAELYSLVLPETFVYIAEV
ncbi:MAG: peptidoglycan DD-metalloendopeptidase family protein [Candidatus Woesearchaeota archaeon]